MEPKKEPIKIKKKLRGLNEKYRIDQVELGKVLIIVSLSILVVSVHAIYTIDGAVDQASQSSEDIQTASMLVNSERFQNSMSSLEDSGATIGGQTAGEITSELRYVSDTVEELEELSQELEDARDTYQWTVLIGLLGLVAGITVIYI